VQLDPLDGASVYGRLLGGAEPITAGKAAPLRPLTAYRRRLPMWHANGHNR
jgi:hypothetical protein